MHLSKNKDSVVSSLFSTVKKSKQTNQLHHAKSYDDIFVIQELQPCEIKILLNNDRSLKNINKGIQLTNIQKNNPSSQQKYLPHTTRQCKQTLSQLLQQSVKKQNLLIKKQLFDPFKYFGSSSQLTNIQQSTRHHQSRLQAMFSQSNSPLATDHSASYRKKSPLNAKKKINLDVHRISNSALIAKLQKLDEHERKMKENIAKKIQNEKKYSAKNISDKQNFMINSIYPNNQSSTLIKQSQKTQHVLQSSTNYHYQYNMNSKKSTQNHEQSSMISSKKMSIQNQSNKTRQVNCSPKSYVKEAKQKYLKMNLNSLQKVRLKLKLTSSKNS